MDALYDMFLTIMLFCMITVGVHALLLLYWLCWANRKYYRWMAAHPTTPSAEADRKPMLGERGGDGYRWGAANPTVPSAEESVATEELVATEEATPLKFSSTAKGAKSTGDDPNDYSSSSSLSAVFAAAPVPSTAAMLHALRVQRSFRALLARRSVQARRAEVDEAAALARAAMFVQKMIRGRHSRAALQEVLRHRVAERSVVGIQRMWRLRQWRRTISHRAPPVKLPSQSVAAPSAGTSGQQSTMSPSPRMPPSLPASPPATPPGRWGQPRWRRRARRVAPSSPPESAAPESAAPESAAPMRTAAQGPRGRQRVSFEPASDATALAPPRPQLRSEPAGGRRADPTERRERTRCLRAVKAARCPPFRPLPAILTFPTLEKCAELWGSILSTSP